VYFIEGASPVSTVSDITSARYYRWTSGVVTANTPTSIALDVDVLTNGYYRVFVANSQGVLSAPAVNKVTISISRVSDVAALTCATGGTCAVGETGPGGGVVFYVATSNFTSTGSDCGTACKYLEVAPSDHSSTVIWCSDTGSSLGVTATGIGSGMSNTTTADSTCTSGAIQVAADYTNSGRSDWYLPSKDELNELCKYAKNTGQAAGGATQCSGGADAAVRGFTVTNYWSSSEDSAVTAWQHSFFDGSRGANSKFHPTNHVRVVRAF